MPDKNGVIEPEQVAEACRSDTVLVSIMYANNEIGIHFPIDRIISSVRRAAPGTLIHCDAVQAAGKMPLSAGRIDIDLMSASAHKLHGPKGCGALYIKKGTRILPRVFGGGHERGIRAGTEPVPLIAAFGAAAEELPMVEEQNRPYHSLRQRLHEGWNACAGWYGYRRAAVPYIVNIAARGLKARPCSISSRSTTCMCRAVPLARRGKATCSPRWVYRTGWWIPRCASAFRIQTRLKI